MSKYKPTKSELSSFCEGMHKMYDFCRGTNPDAVIFPLRGAYPFSVAYRKIAELNQESTPDIILLPLGTFTDLSTKAESELLHSQRFEVIQEGLKNYFADHPQAGKILLVDEVKVGGAIALNYLLLNAYLRKNMPDVELRVCAVEHGQQKRRNKGYDEERPNFHVVVVDSLFTMDNEQFLPKVTMDRDYSFEIEEAGRLEEVLEQIECMHLSRAK